MDDYHAFKSTSSGSSGGNGCYGCFVSTISWGLVILAILWILGKIF